MSSGFTLEKLKKVTHAFDDFTTVEGSDLPEYYKGIFPHHCECGSEVIMTSTSSDFGGYTQLQCCNPYCWVKMAHQFAYFMKTMGFESFGPKKAYNLFNALHDKMEHPTFLSVFDLSLGDIEQVMGPAFTGAFDDAKNVLRHSGHQFKDIIVALGIPDVGNGSKIFDLIKEPRVLAAFAANNKMEKMCELAGIKSPRTIFHLEIARLDILTLFLKVAPNIYSTPKNEVNVAITGSVSVQGKALTRAEFINLCESLRDQNGRQLFKLVETKSQSKLDYVIADGPSSSSKYNIGKQLGILITADNFYELLSKQTEVKDESE